MQFYNAYGAQCCGSAPSWCGSRSYLLPWCGSGSSIWCGSMRMRIHNTGNTDGVHHWHRRTPNNGQKKIIPISDTNAEWIRIPNSSGSVDPLPFWNHFNLLHNNKSALHFNIFVLWLKVNLIRQIHARLLNLDVQLFWGCQPTLR